MVGVIRTIIYIFCIILLDQFSKYFFYDKLILNGSYFVEPAFNTGISWSLPINMIAIIIFSIVIAAIIIIGYKKKYIGKRAMVLMIGGTIGNLIDRLFLGGVRDFILIFRWFPIFNIADVSICLGAILIIIKELFLDKKGDEKK